MTEFEVYLQGGSPWGFRLQGGREFRLPLRIAKVEPGGKADIGGIKVGDHVSEINDIKTSSMYHTEALTAVKRAQSSLSLVLLRPVEELKADTSKKESRVTKNSPVNNRKNYNQDIPDGQGYMKRLVGSTDNLTMDFDDLDLQPFERERSKTLPKKFSSYENGKQNGYKSLPSNASTSGPPNKAPDWYKQMYKEMHRSMEGESHLSKLLSSDAQRGAFRKYDGASAPGSPTNDSPRRSSIGNEVANVPRRLQGGGRSIANHPNRKSLPNIHASNFNFMSANNPQSSHSRSSSGETKNENRKSINSDWYKQLQKGGDIPEAGLATKNNRSSSNVSVTSKSSTNAGYMQKSTYIDQEIPKQKFVPKQSSVNVQYNNPPDFLELRKRELKNNEIEKEREALREKREQERKLEEERLRREREIDRRIIQDQEAKQKPSLTSHDIILEPEIQVTQEEEVHAEPVFTVPEPSDIKPMRAKAKYSFHPQGPGELEFMKGDIIDVLQDIDENWMEGELRGNIGIFPNSYVQIIEDSSDVVEKQSKPTSLQKETRSSELKTNDKESEEPSLPQTFNQPKKIVLPAQEEVIVPVSREEVQSSDSVFESIDTFQPIDPVETIERGVGVAKYTFRPENENELGFKKGEEISIISQIDDNWYEGELSDGSVGIFPCSYVKVMMQPSVHTVEEPKPVVIETTQEVKKENEVFNVDISFEEIFTDAFKPKPSLFDDNYIKENDVDYTVNYEKKDEIKENGIAKDDAIHNLVGVGDRYRAVYGYSSTNEDEVELTVGDIVYVLERCDDGWFVGTSERTGVFGTFPGNYVVQC